jgi:hypothetical protein
MWSWVPQGPEKNDCAGEEQQQIYPKPDEPVCDDSAKEVRRRSKKKKTG